MSQQEIFFGFYFKPTIVFNEADLFGIWCYDFQAQLHDLHQNLEVEEEDGSIHNFREQDFTDFCIMVYTDRIDLIDFSQN